jgi:hypothetical protein
MGNPQDNPQDSPGMYFADTGFQGQEPWMGTSSGQLGRSDPYVPRRPEMADMVAKTFEVFQDLAVQMKNTNASQAENRADQNRFFESIARSKDQQDIKTMIKPEPGFLTCDSPDKTRDELRLLDKIMAGRTGMNSARSHAN